MIMLLLRTKLTIPPKRPSLIPRKRLLDQLNRLLDSRLTLLAAPAGFGKTSLIIDWLDNQKKSREASKSKALPFQSAWFSIDLNDSDPVRFWSYVLTAVQHTSSDLSNTSLSLLQASQPPGFETILITWLNEITAVSTPIVLILDDYHHITSEEIQQQMRFVIDHLPEKFHIVMTSRSDPPVPLSRLRARGQLTELRTDALRFRPEEATLLLAAHVPTDLTKAQIDQLAAQTEGWAAGLHLAALSLQGISDIEAFLDGFSGSHRYILNYLVDEVFEQQSDDVQLFLLETAVLEQLTAKLCDVVTERHHSDSILPYLEKANVFLLPLDDQGRWYRYHQLFSDALKERLLIETPQKVQMLHQRAASWYVTEGRFEAAINHLINAEDWETAVQIIVEQSQVAIGRGDIILLRQWLDRLPDRFLDERPELNLAYAWIFVISSLPEKILPYIARMEKKIAGRDFQAMPPFTNDDLKGQLAVLKAQQAIINRDFEGAIAFCHQALTFINEENRLIFGIIHFVLGVADRFRNQISEAIEALHVSIKYGRQVNHVTMILGATNNLAEIYGDQGLLSQAEQILKDGLATALLPNGRYLPAAAFGLTTLAKIYRQRNQLDLALTAVNQTIELASQAGIHGSIIDGMMTRSLIMMAYGKFDQALDELTAVEKELVDSVGLDKRINAFRARIWYAANQPEQAAQIIERSGLNEPLQLSEETEIECLLRARYLLFCDQWVEASRLLEEIETAVSAAERRSRLIEVYLLQSLIYQKEGDVEKGTAVFIKALTLAEPEHLIRLFLDEGGQIKPILEHAQKYLANNRAVQIFAQTVLNAISPQTEQPSSDQLLDPLKERELEILKLIAAGLSNREIANTLFLTEGTVKSYIHQLYSKLDVHRRTEAVDKARLLNLIN